MKKILIYLVILILVVFTIPIVFTKSFNEKKEVSNNGNFEQQNKNEDNNQENINNTEEMKNIQDDSNQENVDEVSAYDYKKYNTVKLLHAKTKEVEELALDEYLYGVVAAEMPAKFEKEALKAQSIVARTYTVYKIIQNSGKHEGADICDDPSCCQAWISKEDRLNKWSESERESNWGKIVNSVEETKGKIITYEGQPINAFFHSNSGGTTELPVNVWGGTNYPYLQAVETSGEDGYKQYYSEVTLSKDELIQKMISKYSDFNINFDDSESIKILEHTDGARVKTIKIGNKNLSGVEVRSILGLKSANFDIKRENDKIIFSVVGYGHGVGMSQTGADSLAKQGFNFEEIIKHFYSGVEITSI